MQSSIISQRYSSSLSLSLSLSLTLEIISTQYLLRVSYRNCNSTTSCNNTHHFYADETKRIL